jgi:ribose transport system ATP-binding protein
MVNPIVLELTDISKQFPGVKALDCVSFSLLQGEVHGMVGMNGAGKSTLMNIIGGVVQPDSGTIQVNGQIRQFANPAEAQKLGVAFIHQELSLFPNLDIASNIFIYSMPRQLPGIVDDHELEQRAHSVLERVGLGHLKPSQKVSTLSPGEKQLVEIARCLAQETRILVLDEPTSSLTGPETETLFGIIRELKSQDVSIIYVSHRLEEVFKICDRVTVMRDGKYVSTVQTNEVNRYDLVKMILGHEAADSARTSQQEFGPVLFKAVGISRGTVLHDISLEIHRGEILGLAGILGSGRTELGRALFGLDRIDSGEIWINGRKVRIRSPQDAIKNGIAFITENRREEGLLANKPVMDNIVLANLRTYSTSLGWMRRSLEIRAAEQQKEKLNIATPTVKRLVMYLSGGNQQKVVLGKWLETSSRVWIMDEPTRGIDVGAKEEVYRLIRAIADQGAAVIFISSEIAEVVRISDRVLVMRKGNVAASFEPGTFTAGSILVAATEGVA